MDTSPKRARKDDDSESPTCRPAAPCAACTAVMAVAAEAGTEAPSLGTYLLLQRLCPCPHAVGHYRRAAETVAGASRAWSVL